MSERGSLLDNLEIAQMRKVQRRRIIKKLVVALLMGIAAVWGLSWWTGRRVQTEGRVTLAEGYREYIDALRVDLPDSWSIERVVQAHTLAHALKSPSPARADLHDACSTIRGAEYDARGDEPLAPCQGMDLAFGDCTLARRGPAREDAVRFAQSLRACEAELAELMESAGRPMLSFGLDGEPLPDPVVPLHLPSVPHGYDRTSLPLVVPTEQGTVIVEFVDVPCDQPEPGSKCLRHLVYRLTDEGLSPAKLIEPSDSVYRWWRVHPLTDGTILLAGPAPDDRLVVGRLTPEGQRTTGHIEGGKLPRAIVALPGGAAHLTGMDAGWIVHPDLRIEPTDTLAADIQDPAFRSAGPPDDEAWLEPETARFADGTRLQLQFTDGLLVAERRSAGATETALADRAVASTGTGTCTSLADAQGRIAVICQRSGSRFEVVTSTDGGVRWVGQRGSS